MNRVAGIKGLGGTFAQTKINAVGGIFAENK